MTLINFLKPCREAQFTKQIQPHLQRLYQQAYRLTTDQDDAEDLVQDLLLHLYEKEIDLTSIEKPSSWLLRILYNQFIDKCRKKSRLPIDNREHNSDEIIDAVSDELNMPHQLHTEIYTHKTLVKAIQSLNPEQQALISLHDIEGHTLSELSQTLDLPLGTLKSRLHRARHHLRQQLSSNNTEFTEPLSVNKRVIR